MTIEDVANDILRLDATFRRFQSQLEKCSSGLFISVEHSWGRFQAYFLERLFLGRAKKDWAKPTETAEQISLVKKAMDDFRAPQNSCC